MAVRSSLLLHGTCTFFRVQKKYLTPYAIQMLITYYFNAFNCRCLSNCETILTVGVVRTVINEFFLEFFLPSSTYYINFSI